MNINFHYFAVKTLARLAGVKEEEAQKIAYYSQMVDDFGKISTNVKVKGDVPKFFTQNGLAKWIKGSENEYIFYPIVTSIDMMKSEFSSAHLKKTVLPFHFVTKNPINPNAKIDDDSRADYRAQMATDDGHLIWKEIETTIAAMADKTLRERMLVKLGILFHVFADTYAHYDFSGLHGWENWAKATQVYNHLTGNYENFCEPASLYPEIGHACLSHLPDAAAYDVPFLHYAAGTEKRNRVEAVHKNKENFQKCSEQLFYWLQRISKYFPSDDAKIERLEGEALEYYMTTLISASGDCSEEMNPKKLCKIWKERYDFAYHYDSRDYFNLVATSAVDMRTGCQLGAEELKKFEKITMQDNEEGQMVSVSFAQPSQAFYDYNQSAYEHRYEVIGTYTL